MSTFPKTRAAARYAARNGPGELTRTRAAVLLARLDACEELMPDGDGRVPAAWHGLLRDVVLAARDLAGPAWLAATGDDPDTAAFTALQATLAPPAAAELDETIARVLWARFPPRAASRRDTAGRNYRLSPGRGQARPGGAAGGRRGRATGPAGHGAG